MNWKNTFKENLNVLVEKAGKKKGQIAEELGIKGTTFGNYLTGESNPTLQGLIDISKYFGISEADLIHGDISKGFDRTESGLITDESAKSEILTLNRTIEAMEKTIESLDKLNNELRYQLEECRSRNNQVEAYKK